jgi:hypothetical protein
MPYDLMQAVSRPPETKKWFLLLAGAGVLAALGLIALGLFIFISRNAPSMTSATTPTPTATTEPVVETPTLPAGIVIIASATPTIVDAPIRNQAGDTAAFLPTATRRPANTPTPIRPLAPRPSPTITVDGTIELIAPADNLQIASDTVEFKWKWHENKGCEQPPEGFAFEIRVWHDNNAAPPMGAMDARLEKLNIRCDASTGTRAFTIGRIRDVPGAKGLPGGRLRWDVALVQLDPYQPIVTTPYHTFFY